MVGGLHWYTKEDKISLNLPTICNGKKGPKGQTNNLEYFDGLDMESLDKFIPDKITLRELCSRVAAIFDTTGMISPILGMLRNLVREATKEQKNSKIEDIKWEAIIKEKTRTELMIGLLEL